MTLATNDELMIPHPDELFIGGAWEAPMSPEVVDVISPTTEQIIARVPKVTQSDASRAVRRARNAFDNGAWPSMSVPERSEYVARFRRAFDERIDTFNRIWVAETGIPLSTASAFGSAAAVIGDDALATASAVQLTERRETALGPVEVCREPIGTALCILTYNGPGTETAFGVLPALLMGNTVVVKLPPENRLVGQVLADAAHAAGFPDGVVSVLAADADVSKYLVANDGIDLVSFTGGTEIGADVAAACAKRIARVSLELGGKAAAIIAEDADLDEILPTLLGGMVIFQGQLCVALTRILVPRHRHDDLVDKLVAGLQQVRIGDPADPDTEFGPMPSARVRDRAAGYIERAVADGAVIATGGQRPAGFTCGFYIEPTLLINVDNSMEVAQNEIFGPVYAVIPYDGIDDAVRIANDSRYGLASAIFTKDEALARDVARRVRVGAFAINGNFPCLTAPYGGVKQSGYGRVAGPEGMLELTSIKQIVLPAHT